MYCLLSEKKNSKKIVADTLEISLHPSPRWMEYFGKKSVEIQVRGKRSLHLDDEADKPEDYS